MSIPKKHLPPSKRGDHREHHPNRRVSLTDALLNPRMNSIPDSYDPYDLGESNSDRRLINAGMVEDYNDDPGYKNDKPCGCGGCPDCANNSKEPF